MGDIATTWGVDGGDWIVAGPALANDGGLYTAIAISLFTDRLAEASDVLPDSAGSRRGWWGDAYSELQDDRIGSRLWLLSRSKQTTATLRQAEAYAREALQWLLDDGIARAVDVTAEVVREGVLGLVVVVTRSAEPVQRYRFEDFWKGN
jgi:phage gp46-like protein